MSDKNIQVTRSSMPDFEEFVEQIKPLWESHWLTNMGVMHQQLEAELKERLEVENISLFVNGHLALEMILDVFHLKGEVITTPFTFASTSHAIVRNGLTPVFCDIRQDDYTMDADKIEALITENTSAIVPVHVYGNICDVEKIEKIAQKYKLKVIYDAAHAFNESYKGVGVSNYGDASMFSFHATKAFNTIEGGAAVYRDASIKKHIDNLKNFGIRSEVVVEAVGANAKMNEFQAAMGICNLRHLDAEIAKRQKIVERYLQRLKSIEGLQLFKLNPNTTYNFSYFPVVFDETVYGSTRDEVCELLKANGIVARKYFYPLTNSFDCYKGKYRGATPVAEYVAQRVLTLPLYADLQIEDVDRICDIIAANEKK